MNISKHEQRVLHVLAQGGHIRHLRDDSNHISHIDCFTREGYVLTDCTMTIFLKLKSKRLIISKNGAPYRISLLGRLSVRSQLDNR